MPDGTTAGVYIANLTAGTEVSSTGEGRHLTFLASELHGPNATIVKGDPVFLEEGTGDIVGVAFQSESAGTDKITIDTEGIWNLSVIALDADGAGVAIAPGDALYINVTDTTGTISRNHDPEGNIPFGYALGSITSGNTAVIAVKVHWAPHEDYITWGSVTDFTGAVARSRWVLHEDFTGDVGHASIEQQMHASAGSGTVRNNLRGIFGYLDFSGVQTSGGGWQILNGITAITMISGTVYGSTTFVAALYAQVQASGTLTEVSHICAIWGDYAANSGVPTTGSSQILYLTVNVANALLSSAIHIKLFPDEDNNGAECIFYFEDCYFGGASGTPIRDGGLVDGTIDTGGDWKKIAISIDGTIYWLVAMTNPTAS